MKISIWRQFSSNHSASFQVVGKFETIEVAQKAAETMRDMLHLIIQFREGYEEEDPTWPEIEFAKQYQVEWNNSLDWLSDENIHIVQFDQYVFCGNVLLETSFGANPIDKIMEKLGGDVLVSPEIGRVLLGVELTCIAPNLETANSIFEECVPYFEHIRSKSFLPAIPPWRNFSVPLHLTPRLMIWHDELFWGYIQQSDERLMMHKMNFHEIGYGLPPLLRYLEAKDCQNIEYHIEERDQDYIYKTQPPE